MIAFAEQTGSTNADLAAALRTGEGWAEGRWLVARRQTAGRGRQGRAWFDGAGNFMGSTVVRLVGPEQGVGPPPASLSFVAALAVRDACAAALGDIGSHFPDTDAQYKGADSTVLLAKVAADVRALGYQIINLDSTVIAQAPKLAPHIQAMRARIAAVLALDIGCVNVKAKTAEKMGPVGEGRAMEARAVVLLSKS